MITSSELCPQDFSTSQLLLLEIQLETYIDDMQSNDKFKQLQGIVDLAKKKIVETRKHKTYTYVYSLTGTYTSCRNDVY